MTTIRLPTTNPPEGMIWQLQRDQTWSLTPDPDAGKTWYDITQDGKNYCGYTDHAFAQRVLTEYQSQHPGFVWALTVRE
jgi:hypothetical protein